MFTGLVEHTGQIVGLRAVDFGAELDVDPGDWAHRPAVGASIAISGCCLTLARVGGDSERRRWGFDVVRQTLQSTTLGGLGAGDRVNLESSATPTTLLGGHLVQGHVDGVGAVTAVQRDATQWRLRIEPPDGLRRLIVDRGSIAVDGVSLTVAAIGPAGDQPPRWFEVALIPVTLARTTLAALRPGDRVNLESDCIVRAVAHLLRWTAVSDPPPAPA